MVTSTDNIQSLDIESLDRPHYYMVKSIQTEEYAYFVKHLRRARLDSGLSQAKVAKKTRSPSIPYIQHGTRTTERVDIVELKRFTKIYNKDVGYFL